MARRSRAGEYVPTRGPLAGQSFPSEYAYRKASKGYSEEVRRGRAAEKYGTDRKRIVTLARRIGWKRDRISKLLDARTPPDALAHLRRLDKRRHEVDRGRGHYRYEFDEWQDIAGSDLDDELLYYHD